MGSIGAPRDPGAEKAPPRGAWFVTALCSLQGWEALPLHPKDLALTIIAISLKE